MARAYAKLGWHNNEDPSLGLPLGVLYFQKQQIMFAKCGEPRKMFLVQMIVGTKIANAPVAVAWFSYGYEETDTFKYEGHYLYSAQA